MVFAQIVQKSRVARERYFLLGFFAVQVPCEVIQPEREKRQLPRKLVIAVFVPALSAHAHVFQLRRKTIEVFFDQAHKTGDYRLALDGLLAIQRAPSALDRRFFPLGFAVIKIHHEIHDSRIYAAVFARSYLFREDTFYIAETVSRHKHGHDIPRTAPAQRQFRKLRERSRGVQRVVEITHIVFSESDRRTEIYQVHNVAREVFDPHFDLLFRGLVENTYISSVLLSFEAVDIVIVVIPVDNIFVDFQQSDFFLFRQHNKTPPVVYTIYLSPRSFFFASFI